LPLSHVLTSLSLLSASPYLIKPSSSLLYSHIKIRGEGLRGREVERRALTGREFKLQRCSLKKRGCCDNIMEGKRLELVEKMFTDGEKRVNEGQKEGNR